MNTRPEWTESNVTSFNSLFFTKEETIADVVENFNYRRYYSAEGKSITIDEITEQVIIQDHTNPINQTKTDKKLLVPMDSVVKSGSYVKFENETWIVVSHINIVDNAYKTCQIQRCNYTLLFQRLTDYSIVSVPCITSNKSFNNDESKVITLSDNKKSIWLAFNPDTVTLKADRRLYVDRKNPPTSYKIIGDTDTTSTEGLIYFMVEQDTAQNTTQYQDRPDLGICNYHEPVVVPPTPVGNTHSTIKASGDLLIGGRARTLTCTCYNADDTVNTTATITWEFVYHIGYESLFTVTYPTNRTATIKCGSTDDYDKLIGKVVNVSVSDGGTGFVGNLDLKIRIS